MTMACHVGRRSPVEVLIRIEIYLFEESIRVEIFYPRVSLLRKAPDSYL